MIVTRHAGERIRKRCGLPKKATLRSAAAALRNGIGYSECTGRLKKYMEWLSLSHKRCGKTRIYNNHIYLFTVMDCLITVLPLPNEYRDAANKALKRKRHIERKN